ncbi:unnamed protein product, partial [Mesorhabditis belari]|uniref:Uncharacterized protein n=1 Tax=Mesorhabditis belari TaxID=2138241 RepID=A0AAF3F3Z6_9BILA
MKESFTPPLCRQETFQQDEQPPYFVVDLSSRSTSMIGSDSGNESRIDLRAGSIIRRKHQSKTRYLGCAPWLLLAAVLSFKFAILAGWLVREYWEIDKGCALVDWIQREKDLNDNQKKIDIGKEGRYEQLKREKRQNDDDPILDPRFGLMGRKKSDTQETQPVQTSRIQLLQSTGGNTIRTKTIRNRIETKQPKNGLDIPIDGMKKKKKERVRQPVMKMRENDGEVDQIDQIDRLRPPIRLPQPVKPPRIVARESGEEKGKMGIGDGVIGEIEEVHDDGSEVEKSLQHVPFPFPASPSSSFTASLARHFTTKFPRHLVSPSIPQSPQSSSSHFSTPTPNHSPFLSGALDPHDPHFTNKGHIRGYAMKTASKKPAKLKITDSTRLMWHLDELNFTTLFPAGTVPTKEEASHQSVILQPITFDLASTPKTKTNPKLELEDLETEFGSFNVFEVFEDLVKTTMKPKIETTTTNAIEIEFEKVIQRQQRSTTTMETLVEKKEEIKMDKEPILRVQETIPITTTMQSAHEFQEPNPGDSFSNWKKKVEEGHRIQATMKPMGTTERSIVRLDSLQVDVTEEPRRTTVITRYGELPTSKNVPIEVKPGFDRRGDGDKYDRYSSKAPGEPPEKAPMPKNEQTIDIFGDNLQSFADSAICIARTLFDVWCVIQCVCCMPSFLSVCLPSRSLFVVHLVLDVLFLVVAFIFCSTGVVFSMVLFVLVEGMGREILIKWTFLLILFFVLLLVYTAVVVITHRSWELLLESSAIRRKYRRVEKADEIEGEAL